MLHPFCWWSEEICVSRVFVTKRALWNSMVPVLESHSMGEEGEYRTVCR